MNFGKIVEVTEIMKGCPGEHIMDTWKQYLCISTYSWKNLTVHEQHLNEYDF